MNTQKTAVNLNFLDGLRGLAALYVVIGHARWLLWEGYTAFQAHSATYSLFQRLLVYFFSLFRFGHEAVLFFFVLSGFVIHLRYARQIVNEGPSAHFDWKGFVWRRARRLYPPLLAALALSWLLHLIGVSMGYPIYHSATPYPLINLNVVSDVTGPTLFGNLAFLMNTYVPVFGGNGPLWSLKFEWWFYMIYPAFWWISRRSILLASGLMSLLFAASFLPGWPVILLQAVFSQMLAWWLGVLLADVFAGRLKIAWLPVAAICLAGFLASLSSSKIHDLGMAFLFSGVISVGFYLKARQVSLSVLERLKPLGDMSYTLYVTHFPLLMLASGWQMSHSTQGLLPSNFGWVFAGIAVAIPFAYLLHLLVERPFLSRRSRA